MRIPFDKLRVTWLEERTAQGDLFIKCHVERSRNIALVFCCHFELVEKSLPHYSNVEISPRGRSAPLVEMTKRACGARFGTSPTVCAALRETELRAGRQLPLKGQPRNIVPPFALRSSGHFPPRSGGQQGGRWTCPPSRQRGRGRGGGTKSGSFNAK